jgi:hypothetical protein
MYEIYISRLSPDLPAALFSDIFGRGWDLRQRSGESLVCYDDDSPAGVAQLVEHLICNQRVGGSIPSASSS